MLSKKTRIILFLTAILIIGIFLFKYFVAVERIDAGHTGIRVNLVGSHKGVDDITEVTGYVFYMPLFTMIYEFPTFTQVKDYDLFVVNAKDGSEFTVDPTFSYYVDEHAVPKIFKQYRKSLNELESGFLKNVIYDCYRIVANQYTSDSLMSNRQKFEEEVQSNLSKTLKQEGFIFQQLTSNIIPPKSLKDAIDAKNKTTQEALQAENKLRQAEADAKAKIITAEAEKRVNDLKASALTPLIIQQMFIEKWDGKLPVYGEIPTLFKDIAK
ncbi:MAG: prohibitin family protein [Tannerella sp.]|jgi:regulator of protease activity HflC (stomatin/prohibitin superfamily)|nr:prohibitin family protein [Tannerella sp.]